MTDPDQILARLRTLEIQAGIQFRLLLLIAKGLPAMSELTDKLKAIAVADAEKIATLAGFNGDSNTALADLLPIAQANSDALDKAIKAHKVAHAPAANDDVKVPAPIAAPVADLGHEAYAPAPLAPAAYEVSDTHA